jgi:hypothetical protein
MEPWALLMLGECTTIELQPPGWSGIFIYDSKCLLIFKRVPANRRHLAGCWWLTPVILATWEAEIEVPGQPNSSQELISKITRAKWTGGWLKQLSTCFASAKPWVQTPVPQKKNSRDLINVCWVSEWVNEWWTSVEVFLFLLLKK